MSSKTIPYEKIKSDFADPKQNNTTMHSNLHIRSLNAHRTGLTQAQLAALVGTKQPSIAPGERRIRAIPQFLAQGCHRIGCT